MSKVSSDGQVSPAVLSIREKLLDGHASVHDFAQATGHTKRTVQGWLALGMPKIRIGRTPYIPIESARNWLTTRAAEPVAVKRGRPRKAA